MARIKQEREIPVVVGYDVVVCGGGPGGIIAALASAREGAKTCIIERYGFLGGMATAGLVAPISVFNYNGRRIIDGLPWEFVERLAAIGGAREEKPLGNITFSPEKYKLVAQRMLKEAGVDIYFHSYITGAEYEKDPDGNSRIRYVIIDNKNGAEAIAGRYFIDATGESDLAAMAGVPMQPVPEQLQPASLIFMLSGVDTDALPMIRHSQQGVNYHDLKIRDLFTKLREEGTEDVPMFGGPWYCGILADGIVLVNMTRHFADMTDNRVAGEMECLLRENAHRYTELLRKYIPAFKNAELIATAPMTGIRETRRILGAHTLTGEEYLEAIDFPDSVARGCHPVDIHSANSTSQRCQFMKDAGFVPYRSLYAPSFPNLLVAGRNFSADEVASASVRVQASVMGLGQAAGTAAAIAAKGNTGVDKVNTDTLRARLLELGANLSN